MGEDIRKILSDCEIQKRYLQKSGKVLTGIGTH